MLKKTNSTSLPAQVRDEIINDIMTGVIQPGNRIVEEEYASRLNISRASVREAVFMLISEGVATKIEKKGTFINAYTLEEHIDLYSLRFFLEQQAIAKIEQIEDLSDFIIQLRMLSDLMYQNLNNVSQLSILNYQFHYEFIKFSKSRVLIERYPSFFVSINFLQHEAYVRKRGEINRPIDEHSLIIQALEQRDFENLRRIVDQHHSGIIELLNQQLI